MFSSFCMKNYTQWIKQLSLNNFLEHSQDLDILATFYFHCCSNFRNINSKEVGVSYVEEMYAKQKTAQIWELYLVTTEGFLAGQEDFEDRMQPSVRQPSGYQASPPTCIRIVNISSTRHLRHHQQYSLKRSVLIFEYRTYFKYSNSLLNVPRTTSMGSLWFRIVPSERSTQSRLVSPAYWYVLTRQTACSRMIV